MKTACTENSIPTWKTRWNEIRNGEIEKARILAEEYAHKAIITANPTIFQLLHNGEQPAVKMTNKAFEVWIVDSEGKENCYMSCNFNCICGLCPDAKAEFIRVYHIILTREYGELELDKLSKLVPDPVSSEYVPNMTN